MPTPLPQRKEAKDDEQCIGGHIRLCGAHACDRCWACKLQRRWGAGGSSGGGGKYGSSSSAATTKTKGASGGTLKTIVIKETELKFSPSIVTLSKPGTYAFKAENEGSAEHSLEIDGKDVKSKGG
jgi:hypothetical protein